MPQNDRPILLFSATEPLSVNILYVFQVMKVIVILFLKVAPQVANRRGVQRPNALHKAEELQRVQNVHQTAQIARLKQITANTEI